MPELVVAITGASGSIYARRLLECLVRMDARIHLIMSDMGAKVLHGELGIRVDPLRPDVSLLTGGCEHNVIGYSYLDMAAPISSGTCRTDGMVIIPCTTGTMGSIASGICRSLIDRAADVTLKERRRLICVLRETPLSEIHIENMLRLTRAGGVILPACPGFYGGQKTLDDLVDFVVGKVLDSLGIGNDIMKRWKN